MGRLTLSKIGAGLLAATAIALVGCGSGGGKMTSSKWHANLNEQSPEYSQWWDGKIVYHKDSEVYFDPYSQTYYWMEMDNWVAGNQLPRRFSLRRTERSIVTRNHMLKASKNSQYVMAFNPHYEAPASQSKPMDPVLQAAENAIQYED
ncbi:MAG: hypothetical protein ACYTGG_02150 [Planctomycetota bacterium]